MGRCEVEGVHMAEQVVRRGLELGGGCNAVTLPHGGN
jgi:hypothetical protein